MPSSVSDARAIKSRDALRAAMLALADRKPLQDITVRELCAEAGVHYATFFRHHSSKEALLVELAAQQITQVVELALPVFTSADSHDAVLALLRYIDKHRTLWAGLLSGSAAGAMRDEFLQVSREVAMARGAKGDWLPLELAVDCSVLLMIETLAYWLGPSGQTLSLDQVARMLDRLLSAVRQE